MGNRPILVMTADHRAFSLQPVHVALTESAIQELRKTSSTETQASVARNWSSGFILQLAAEAIAADKRSYWECWPGKSPSVLVLLVAEYQVLWRQIA